MKTISLKPGSLLDRPVTQFLAICFAVLPLFYNLWSSFNFTVQIGGSDFMKYILYFITLLAIIRGGRFRRSYLFFWIGFIAVMIVLAVWRKTYGALWDFLFMACCCLICMMLSQFEQDMIALERAVFLCGLFVSVTVILDSFFGAFKTNDMIRAYVETAAAAKLRLSASGGIFPYTGTAGGYICTGAAAYWCLLQTKHKGKLTIANWAILAVMLLALILIRKRGFALYMLAAPLAIWIFGWRTTNDGRLHLQRYLRILLVVVIVVGILLTVYYTMPTLRRTVDVFLRRFYSGDDTLSGRTFLYRLAWDLFNRNRIFGIGWGRYRSNSGGIFGRSSNDYAAHNIYLQVLCETGIVGFAFFILAVGSALVFAVRKYRKLRIQGAPREAVVAMQFGLFLELFFLMYGMSGNPLYDENFLLSYFLGVLVAMSVPMQVGESAGASEANDRNDTPRMPIRFTKGGMAS